MGLEDLVNQSVNQEQDALMNIICAATGRKLTEEQKDFARSFNEPTICFADAGTGKTYASSVGIIFTQLFHKIQGDEIAVMSFTNEASWEIKKRYDRMREFSPLRKEAGFSTFHSLCAGILKEVWGRGVRWDSGKDYYKQCTLLQSICETTKIGEVDGVFARTLLKAINTCNARFIWDPNHLEDILEFKDLNISAELFNQIRVEWFLYQRLNKVVPRGDIPIHCFYELYTNEELRAKYYKKFKVLLIDEFQDMSVLYVKIISYLCQSSVVIGDMKQQIFSFNGASDEIVQEFLKEFPKANICELTQSFRFKDEIAAQAMYRIAPNKPESTSIKGVGPGGVVTIEPISNIDYDKITKGISEEFRDLERGDNKDYLFLFRNNASMAATIEKFYQAGIPFRCSAFKKVSDYPIFDAMCALLEAVENPKDQMLVSLALSYFPEFKNKNTMNLPIFKVMEETEQDFLTVNYRFRQESSTDIMNALRICKNKMNQNDSCGHLFNELMGVYGTHIINNKWWTLEFSKEFYCSMVADIVEKKTFRQMMDDETAKYQQSLYNAKIFKGVRCYTIHSAKGLEADYVYLLDADDGIMPSSKNLKKSVDKDCLMEAARTVRNERNLIYVAITRAKEECHIYYRGECSSLVSSPMSNEYSYLDEFYENNKIEFKDTEWFFRYFNMEG